MNQAQYGKLFSVLLSLSACMWTATAAAHAPSGAIFTTLPDGSEVNFNIYPSKDLVYLDGGPGIGAPVTAAGLDDGIYVFQVTDPSGKTLLSTDAANCRQFSVAGGVITSVVMTGCQHVTGVDVDHGAVTVQLMPYMDTPNRGGGYKAWVVRVDDFLAGCSALGVANGLDVVDCGKAPGNSHGFIPRHTKTDNFKVGNVSNLEIDTRFYDDATGQLLDGIGLTWVDTLGSSNVKYSYYKPQINVLNFSHIEAVEAGVHSITVTDQPGCKVVKFFGNSAFQEINGPGTIDVQVKPNDKMWTHYLYVYCNTAP